LTATVHFFPFKFKFSKATSIFITSVAGPGCLSRIQNPNFSILDPGSRVKKILDPESQLWIRINEF
jgi:hypothetical protein